MTSAGLPSATSVPLCSTMMRSASERTTSILCSTSRMILEVSCLSCAIRSSTTGTSSTLMPTAGMSGDELAIVQHDDALGERAHHVHLVLDQQDDLGGVLLELRDQEIGRA